MKRTLFAFVLAAICLPVFAQDAVLMQIEADKAAWQQHLSEQYTRNGLSRGDYERQLQTLDRNIEVRRQQRYAELEQADLRRREVKAQEQAANNPPVFVQQPSRSINCTTNRIGNSAYTSCY